MTTITNVDPGPAPAPRRAKVTATKKAALTIVTTGKARTPRRVTAAPPTPDSVTTLPSPSSKLDRLTTLLTDPAGATIAAMTASTGWQAHSVRGAMAGALRKRGLTVVSSKIDGVRTYRAGPAV